MLSVVSQNMPLDYPSRLLCSWSDPMSYSFRQSQKILWSYRSFIESKVCYSKGGYVLFDTLTYSDASLSYFHDHVHDALYTAWDFPCFSRRDIQLFFKRLRKRLHDHYGIDGGIRYLLTCEYGSEDKTFRPHYHVLFFVTAPINPVSLSCAISASWWQGLTDGCPNRNSRSLLANRVFRSIDQYSLNVVSYVTKYITKQFYTYTKLYKRVFSLMCVLHPDWMDSYSFRLEFIKLKNTVLPFHLQSVGFGSDFEIHESKESVIDKGCFTFVYNGNYVTVPITGYYRRKIFYHTDYKNGRLYWCPNDDYCDFVLKTYDCRVRDYAIKLSTYFPSLSFQDLSDLADYYLFRRGLFIPDYMQSWSTKDILSWLYTPSRYTLKEAVCGSHLFVHGSFKDKVRFLGCFVSEIYISKYINNTFYNNFITNIGFRPRPTSVGDLVVYGNGIDARALGVCNHMPCCYDMRSFLKHGYPSHVILINDNYERLLQIYELEQKRLDNLCLLDAQTKEYYRDKHKSRERRRVQRGKATALVVAH